ncbi:craniofacial development protein 2-like [Artemia franciscana]|uniref:Endonuclease/exonuclease/phosphatase domain-containing protein n=1 Tax=Artemia franciscana TaxID=6661 RepID=A0AA88KY65_ARTSF|nr:hypothetical protein QYM36_016438 [Artemia franciscana]
MRQYDLDILTMSEVRWPGSGLEKLPSRQESRREHGVALMMTRETSQSLVKWQPVSSRTLTARFSSQHAKLSLVVCYALTNEASDDIKRKFHRTLQSVARNIPRQDIACFVNFNAKIGDDRKYCPQSIGCNDFGNWNENGELLMDLVLSNDLVIGGSLFQHHDVHRYSWPSPDGVARNQIDHCLVSRKWCTSLIDIRSHRGVDSGQITA